MRLRLVNPGYALGFMCFGVAAYVYANMADVTEPPRPIVPDPTLTPGAVETSDPAVICAPGYLAGRPRAYGTPAEHAQWARVFGSYHVPLSASKDYELDHLIPRCLGGADSDANLWPQTREGRWNAERKDTLEREACRLACKQMSASLVRVMQDGFARNWVELYKEGE